MGKRFGGFVLLALLCCFILPAKAEKWTSDGCWRYTINNGKARITDYRKPSPDTTEATVPSLIENCPTVIEKLQITLDTLIVQEGVSEIAGDAFQKSNVEHIIVESSSTTLSPGAFQSCAELQSAALPDDLQVLPELCFSGCSSLTNVSLPQALVSIGENCFSGCTALETLVLPDHVQTIGNSAFSACYELSAVWLPDSLTSIGSFAFADCEALKTIALPDSVSDIGSSAFTRCSSLEDIQLPATLSGRLKPRIFQQCEALETIRIPDGISELGKLVFERCRSLRMVYLPSQLTSVPAEEEDDPFRNCPVPSFYAERGTWAYDWAIRRRWHYLPPHDPNPLIIPASVAEIGEEAFMESGCREVILSEGIRCIRSRAFANCAQLVYVTLPKSLEIIDEDAFGTAENIIFLVKPESRHISWAEQNGYHCKIINENNNEP